MGFASISLSAFLVAVPPSDVTEGSTGLQRENLATSCVSRKMPKKARIYVSASMRYAAKFDVPLALVFAVMRTESNFNPSATSSKGAQGLMQLMPSTAEYLGVKDRSSPEQNIRGGVKFLRLLANRFNGDMVLILAGYHAGAGAVQRAGGVPNYPVTRRYVRAVVRRYFEYKSRLLKCASQHESS